MLREPVPRILIVEDEADIALEAQRILESDGYEVSGIASDAVIALQLAAKSPPDIAIVDVSLSGEIDGVSVAQELWERHATQIVFVTGFCEDVLRNGYGFDYQLIAKPFFEADLLDAVQENRMKRG